jgi:hypothetical protein
MNSLTDCRGPCFAVVIVGEFGEVLRCFGLLGKWRFAVGGEP